MAASVQSRIAGIDLARGAALATMLAVHVFPTFNRDGSPTIATVFASGRGAALFAMMAGVGLAMVTGRREPLTGRARLAASVGLLVRAVMLLLVGLLLGYVTIAGDLDVYVILPYYAVMFVLATGLLGLRPKTLLVLGPLLAISANFLIQQSLGDVPNPSRGIDPTLGDVLSHPLGMLALLLFGGAYPAVVWMAYVCTGIGLGRLDLSSKTLAIRLVIGGSVLAAAAWLVSGLLLFQFGGLEQLRAARPRWSDARLLWEPWGDFSTFWWFAGRAPHSGTPLDLLHTLGVAMAVFGAALLLSRSPSAYRFLRPVAASGSMILTLYCGHIVLLAATSQVFKEYYYPKYVLILVAMVVFATLWRRGHRRGPLEEGIARVVAMARRAVRQRPTGAAVGDAAAVSDQAAQVGQP